MSSFGQVPLKDVFAMLDECAPGHTVTETDHYFCIRYNTRTFPNFPKGEHGKNSPPIQHGHVRKLARYLQIEDCAFKFLGWPVKKDPQ